MFSLTEIFWAYLVGAGWLIYANFKAEIQKLETSLTNEDSFFFGGGGGREGREVVLK